MKFKKDVYTTSVVEETIDEALLCINQCARNNR